MEKENKKCFNTEHEESEANSYCIKCNTYFCKKCEALHSKLFKFHETILLDKINIEDIFTGYCKEEDHNSQELEFFCKTHNQLCCAICICKIKTKNVGIHKDCNICLVEDIKNEKKNKLKENIGYLKELSNNLEEAINGLKNIFEKANKDKEELKINIQKIFTKLRNALNDREDELLLEIENKFNELYAEEIIIKECEKLPKKVKNSLERSENINNEKEDKNKINIFLNECINVENNIQEIKIVQENIKKFNNSKDLKLEFDTKEDDINNILENIKKFGVISFYNNKPSLNSNIVNQKEEEVIINFLPNKIISAKLIFDTNIDGDSIEAFQNKCHGKSPTLCIVKTTKGIIFGGYASSKWDEDKYIKDDNSFVFSLNPNKKYFVTNKQFALYGYSKYNDILFQFGGCCFRIVSNCTKNNKSFIEGNDYEKGLIDLIGGDHKFIVCRIEIFHLNLKD